MAYVRSTLVAILLVRLNRLITTMYRYLSVIVVLWWVCVCVCVCVCVLMFFFKNSFLSFFDVVTVRFCCFLGFFIVCDCFCCFFVSGIFVLISPLKLFQIFGVIIVSFY